MAFWQTSNQHYGAREDLCYDRSIGDTEMCFGDSIVLLAEAREQWKAMPTTLALYVEDAAAYARAPAVGASAI